MKSKAIVIGLAMAMGIVGAVDAGPRGKGPRVSIEVAAYCGDPVAVDVDGVPFGNNVGIVASDESGDAYPNPVVIQSVTVTCLAKLEGARGKNAYFISGDAGDVVVSSSTVTNVAGSLDFGRLESSCPMDVGEEWKAEVSVTAVDVTDPDKKAIATDTCEEVPSRMP